jgi:beta-alanine--pyruvate transaminase
LETYADENLLTRASKIGGTFEKALHSLADAPHVIDIRNIGLVGAVELEPLAGAPGKRAFETMLACWNKGLMVRTTGDTIALSPPLIIEDSHINTIAATLSDVLRALD